MTSKITNTHSNQQPAGVPPAPSEAHQRAAGGIVGISCTDVAKLVRKALKEAFPDVVFSVRSSKASMYAGIGVSWTDGPCEALVDPVVDRFSGSKFDGMNDHTINRTHMFKGQVVSLQLDSVRTSRHYSPEAVQRAIDRVMRMYADEFVAAGVEAPTVGQFKSGSLIHMQLPGMFDDMQREIHRVLYKSSDRLAAKNSPTAANMIHIASDGRAVVTE